MVNTARIVETLGGTHTLKRTIGSWEDLHKRILAGLPVSTYTHLLAAFSLTAPEAADFSTSPSEHSRCKPLGPTGYETVNR